MPEAEPKPSNPTFTVSIECFDVPNQPGYTKFRLNHYELRQLSLSLAIHPNNSGRIVIIYPGLNEDLDGFNSRYKEIANQLQKENIGAVIRSEHRQSDYFLPSTPLKKIIEYSQTNAKLICNDDKPEILLMGFSAGASAIASLAGLYEGISRILLIAPSGDMPKELVQLSLNQYKGEVYIIIGEYDEVVSLQAGKIYYDLAKSASKKDLLIVPKCDHFFQGDNNDKIFKKAPFDVFALR